MQKQNQGNVNQKDIDKPFFKATIVDVVTDDNGEEKGE